MNDELKPCPFCGGDFYFHEIEETGIEVRHNPIGDCPIEPLLGWYYTKEIALKTLNTRPLEDALRAQLAEKDAELNAADTALNHMVEYMKNPNNRGHMTLLQTCRFFDELINTAIKIRARII